MEFSRIALAFVLLGMSLSGCNNKPEEPVRQRVYQTQQFRDYWHAGKAEVSSYVLKQSRYGETRNGKAVLIFVTEDLSRKLHVKLDDPTAGRKVNVMKMNFMKNFITGIYPYSLMLSVFTPTNLEKEPATLKTTMSSQEWCGQIYTQLNLRGNRYAIKSHSYFEQEADQRFSVRHALLEDEIWNLIRLDHDHLPEGKIEIIPGLFYSRLNHMDLKVRNAVGERSETDSAYTFSIRFPEEERELLITYEKSFPFKIQSWSESWTENGETMETTATLDQTLFIDYWTKNKNEFLPLRDSLNLPVKY